MNKPNLIYTIKNEMIYINEFEYFLFERQHVDGVIDRVEQDKNDSIENEGYFEQDINYDEYKKS